VKFGAPARMLFRMVVTYAIVSLLCSAFPGPILRALAPVVRIVTDWTSPYVENVQLSLQDKTIRVDCHVRLNMTRADGSLLPLLAGFSEKGVWQTLYLVVMALTVFAAPAMPLRRRLVALPATLVAVALVCAYQQSIEIQSHVLQTVGSTWLQSVQPAPTEANLAYFKTMQSWFDVMWRLKNVNAGGGALFLAVLCGLVGYSIPDPARRNRPPVHS
jgi:hypothetical protein